MSASDLDTAASLMAAFAQRTGLVGDAAPVRYLWTDAFAVGNFQALAEAGAGAGFDGLAQRTIEQVHAVLGHFRADDPARAGCAARTATPTRPTPPAPDCASASPCPSAAWTNLSMTSSNGSATASTSIT